ncbi:MAG: tRNA (5-methylaminomethyl-2-thiouridine)(34)-methyltransferase MnmD [Candidatus Omnitrophica bacterium]|nr:tRNA (5-methylaminomethyl-2-thiouridine)(34)-methyltransferase MnmD [Candidatus Omnitrophota bacterium]
MADSDDLYAEIIWDNAGAPHSAMFGDKYFCLEDGYEEARHVNCAGNALEARFKALDPNVPGTFTIIETGFGTGLDFCCAWQEWEAFAPESWTLRFLSLELYPLSSQDLSRALAAWPALAVYRDALVAQYAPAPGKDMDFYFDHARIHLTVIVDDVVEALHKMRLRGLAGAGADAWFLDGFGPAKNPQMWSEAVFAAMAPLSRPGSTLSTFTVAGFVRRGLEANGFRVQKVPGYGKKRHILIGRRDVQGEV